MINFSDCKIEKLEKMFGLRSLPVNEMAVLESWLQQSKKIAVTKSEQNYILKLQPYLNENVAAWNEIELAMHFIGPMFALVEFNYHRQFNMFAERALSGKVDDIELGGKPDGLIATGYWQPEKPYFCFQEYKRDKDPDGDPQAQVLAAMLVAQEINEHQFPVYGCYVRGAAWHFMALEGREYGFTNGYIATGTEVFDILRILKVLKRMIIARLIAK